MLLSLVRTRSVGHVRDVRRLVVAMSRARLGLMLAILGVGLSARTEFAFDWRGLLAAEASALASAVGSGGQKRALLAPSLRARGQPRWLERALLGGVACRRLDRRVGSNTLGG